ncbi:hypothetical protein [Thermobacillus sp. ZCTH02-B1]|uniref:hypothetical protein n=1 Tax=Thermobacillus sp. ZCTH02-B1 TaxID=1858795 RepID=UPI0025D5AFD7|nr:hypothetical protein [Thermobacillus sp. ZCTH02-B1]
MTYPVAFLDRLFALPVGLPLQPFAEAGGRDERHRDHEQIERDRDRRVVHEQCIPVRAEEQIDGKREAERAGEDECAEIVVQGHDRQVHEDEEIGRDDGIGDGKHQRQTGHDDGNEIHDRFGVPALVRHDRRHAAGNDPDNRQHEDRHGRRVRQEIDDDAENQHAPDDVDEQFVPSVQGFGCVHEFHPFFIGI